MKYQLVNRGYKLTVKQIIKIQLTSLSNAAKNFQKYTSHFLKNF